MIRQKKSYTANRDQRRLYINKCDVGAKSNHSFLLSTDNDGFQARNLPRAIPCGSISPLKDAYVFDAAVHYCYDIRYLIYLLIVLCFFVIFFLLSSLPNLINAKLVVLDDDIIFQRNIC